MKKVKIFRKNKGDGDLWLRTSWWWQRNKMNSDDWILINELIQDIKLVDKGLASNSYVENVSNKIEENCESEIVVKELKKLAREM